MPYHSDILLYSKELGKSTIPEAELSLQAHAKPVDNRPCRIDPRAQEVIDKCVDCMEFGGIIEKSPSA